jgi:hypothetical protein
MLLAGTITKLPPEARGAVVVCGSHGGRYPGYLAARAGVRAVILNDAGVGRDEAGIGALPYLEALGIAAATVSHRSCLIGDAADMAARGVISRVSQTAAGMGVAAGMACGEAARLLAGAPLVGADPPAIGELRSEIDGARRVVLVDSASLVRAEDAGQIVVTGSHGGLIGGDPAMALRTDAFAAVFNDAGRPDGPGVSRLPALEARGIAAVTVGAESARIGEARSSYQDGVISAVNGVAARLGARVGGAVRVWLDAYGPASKRGG